MITPPNDTSERLALYRQVLAAGSDRIDVFQIDVVWPGLLAEHLLDLRPYSQGIETQHLPGMVANATVHGRLLAMPWFTDAGVLYYRRDLLARHRQPVPTTWDELQAVARRIQAAERAAGNDRMWGYVWQGRAYEGLTCNALEWIAGTGGGAIVDAGGAVTVRNEAARRALARAASWIGTISPRAVLTYGEEESRGVFEAGNAVFMRNWPYAWSLAQAAESPVRGRIGIAPLPHGATALGGSLLAVSRYSRHPALAADLVLFMTGAAVQKERALKASYNPSLEALYQDADVLALNPYLREFHAAFNTALRRPNVVTGGRYADVSREVWNAVHAVLSGERRPHEALDGLDAALRRMSPGGHWE